MTTTSNICFTLNQDPTGGLNTCMDVVWGREGLTDPYATAFVEVSRWVGTNNTTNTVGNLYDDLNSGDGNEACFNTSCPAVDDYNIRMVLDSVDCTNDRFCYEVQLSSASGLPVNLAGQNYRLYYDGSKMSYFSGTSLLPIPTYTDYTLSQNIENQDASATNGALSFEANLSFLNYTMDLNDLIAGGVILPANGSWVGTSQLCFNAAFDLSQVPLTCIEAVWARVV